MIDICRKKKGGGGPRLKLVVLLFDGRKNNEKKKGAHIFYPLFGEGFYSGAVGFLIICF